MKFLFDKRCLNEAKPYGSAKSGRWWRTPITYHILILV